MLGFLILLLIALYSISSASDFFVDSASALGEKFGLRDYMIGSLIVGIGTSLPELVTSVSAVLIGQPSLVAPNVFGTIIANVLAGLGLSTMFLFFLVKKKSGVAVLSLRQPLHGGQLDFRGVSPLDTAMPIALLSVILSWFLCRDGSFSRVDSLFFVLGYVIFMGSELSRERGGAPRPETIDHVVTEVAESYPASRLRLEIGFREALRLIGPTAILAIGYVLSVGSLAERTPRDVVGLGLVCVSLLVLSAVELALRAGSKVKDRDSGLSGASSAMLIVHVAASLVLLFESGTFIVRATVALAGLLGFGSTVLAASVIALGTSLPDILVAIKVARRGRHQMLIGHILQSNIFDVLLIMGVCGAMVRLPVDAQTLGFTLPFAIGVNLVLLSVLHDERVSGAEGSFLTMAYVAFLAMLYGAL